MSRWGGRRAQALTRLVLSEYGNQCHLCLRLIRLDLPVGHADGPSADHLVPRSRGGSDDLSNLRPAHKRCNSRRGARPLTTVTARPAESGAGFPTYSPWKPRPHLPFSPEGPEKTAETRRSDPERL